MGLIKALIFNKFIWVGIASSFLIQSVVDVNKEHNEELLKTYYGTTTPADTISDTTSNEEVEIADVPQKKDSIINYAQTLLGKEYTYGGTGPESFDCSGFICYVFNQYNVKLPRSSKTQSKKGEPLPLEQVKKGDLLFFKSPTVGNPNVGHVGIVVANKDGDVDFIHSSTGRGVVIDNIDNGYYRQRFMEARRVLKD